MFRFSLEAVLKQRKRLEELAQLSLAEELRRESNLTTAIATMEGERRRDQNELVRREAEGLRVSEYLLRRWRLDGLYRQIQGHKKRLLASKREVIRRRQSLVEAAKKKKVVQRLKERAWLAYLEEERHAEMKTLDEFAVLHHARRRVERDERG